MTFDANNYNTGHRKRLRERFLTRGGDSLQKYEKLELLLTYAIPCRDVKPIAKALLNKFDTLQNLMNASVEEITSVAGISENSAALILLVKELCATYLEEKLPERPILDSAEEVANFARMKIGGAPKETYMMIFLNSRNQIINYQCFPHGTIDRTTVYLRELVELCLKNKATSFIMVHNHPSGLCIPSTEDLNITLRISRTFASLGIKLHDHIIVSSDSCHSMLEKNELKKHE